jgi:hypothetical protein
MAGLNMLNIKSMIVMVIVGYRRFMPYSYYSYTTCGVMKGSTNVPFQAPIHIELMKLNRELFDKI